VTDHLIQATFSATFSGSENNIMTTVNQKVAVITGASQSIGAALVQAYRKQRWAVVANSRSITPSDDANVVTVAGDIADPTTPTT
jgi:NAD(P)-dependent dehydrogenase (short-subunit alcohol dehydrogenase family)